MAEHHHAELDYGCRRCRDRGFVEVDAERRTVRRCACQGGPSADTHEGLVAILRAAGVPEVELESAFGLWNADYWPPPQRLWAWARDVAGDQPPLCRSWLLGGGNGRGKSKAAVMAVVEYLRAGGGSVVWLHAREAAKQVAIENYENHGDSPLVRRMRGAGLLVLDEAGSEKEDHVGEVESWLVYAHSVRQPVIVTTNGDPLEIWDGRLASRLDDGEIERFEAEQDYRSLRAARRAGVGAAS